MARPRLSPSGTERVNMWIGADLVTAIETWRYANRVPSFSDALRQLCVIGLAAAAPAPQVPPVGFVDFEDRSGEVACG